MTRAAEGWVAEPSLNQVATPTKATRVVRVMMQEGKRSFQRTLCVGLNRAVSQIIILEMGLCHLCPGGEDLAVPSVSCPCRRLVKAACVASVARGSVSCLCCLQQQGSRHKKLVMDRKLDRN